MAFRMGMSTNKKEIPAGPGSRHGIRCSRFGAGGKGEIIAPGYPVLYTTTRRKRARVGR